jgi:hypothetical protein
LNTIISMRASDLGEAKNEWLRLLDDKAVTLVMPSTDLDLANKTADILISRSGVPAQVLIVEDDVQQGSALILNRVCQSTTCHAMAYVAQDVFPGRLWLKRALTMLTQDKAGLVAFNDGKWCGEIASYGLLKTQWIRKVYGGGLFYKGYKQHYGDVELSLIARSIGAFSYDPHAVLIEIDPEKDQKKVNEADREMFSSRKLSGFDGKVRDMRLLGMFG